MEDGCFVGCVLCLRRNEEEKWAGDPHKNMTLLVGEPEDLMIEF